MKRDEEPFNDVIDHMNKIEGNAANIAKTDLSKMPKPIRYIGYFMIGFLSIATLMGIVLSLMK
jgi:hypothetical protein